MKSKLLFCAAFALLFSRVGYGQYFNHYIPNFALGAENTETITEGINGESVFLTAREYSPNHPRDFGLAKVDAAGLYKLEKDVYDTLGAFTPCSIIRTQDSGFIVIGTFVGTPPYVNGYPPVSGGVVHTTFYARFDNSFNLLWYRLHYGTPINTYGTIGQQIDPRGIIAVPDLPEHYIVLNLGLAYDTINNKPISIILLDKIDGMGNLIKEVQAPVGNNHYINILSAISYLRVNDKCAVTGGYYDFTIPGSAPTPFLITFDRNLTAVSNFTSYPNPSPGIANFVPSNVVEDPIAPSQLLFAFTTTFPSPYVSPCTPKASTLAMLKVKAALTSSILFSKNYTSPCMRDPRPPLTIKTLPTDLSHIMVGFTEIEPGAPLTLLPGIMKLGTNGSVFNYHLYNPGDDVDFLRYMANYTSDSLMLHVDSYINDSVYGTRIIKTDRDGQTYCAALAEVDTSNFPAYGIDSSIAFIVDSTHFYKDAPVLTPNIFAVAPCDSTFGRPAGAAVKILDYVRTLTLYPNPATDELNLSLEGAAAGSAYSISITNAVGQGIISQQVRYNGRDVTVDVHRLTPGSYIFRLYDDKNFLVQKTFIKQ